MSVETSFLQNQTGIVVDCVTNSDIDLNVFTSHKYYIGTRLVFYGSANLNFMHGPPDLP